MLEGGANKPFPASGCPQKCFAGSPYQNGSAKAKATRKVNTTVIPNPDGGNTPMWESYNDPTTDPCDDRPPDSPPLRNQTPGNWISNNLYGRSLISGQPSISGLSHSVPTQIFTATKTVIAIAIANGGSNWMVGDIIQVSGGTIWTSPSSQKCTAMVIAITPPNPAIPDVGAVKAVKIQYGGDYTAVPSNPAAATWIGGPGSALGHSGLTLALIIADQQIDYSVCLKTGFKTVAGVRQWHGEFGFLQTDRAGYVDTECSDHSAYKTYHGTPSDTKYTTIAVDCKVTLGLSITNDVTYTNPGDGSLIEHEVVLQVYSGVIERTQTSSVNPLSGEVTLGGASATDGSTVTQTDTVTLPSGTTVTGPTTTGPVFIANSFFSHPFVSWSNWSAAGIAAFFGSGYYDGVTYPGVSGTIDQINDQIAAVNASQPNFTYSATFSISDTGFTANITMTGNGAVENTGSGEGHFPPDPIETIPYNFDSINTSSGSVSWDITVTLSNPNKSSDVYSDLCHHESAGRPDNLLSVIPLNDDKLYPFRNDSMPQVAPLVSRNEKHSNQTCWVALPATGTMNDYTTGNVNDVNGVAPGGGGYIPTWNQMAWKDVDGGAWGWVFPAGNSPTTGGGVLVQYLDGQILGALKPAGYEGDFCFQFEDWQGCCIGDVGDRSFSWFLKGYGRQVSSWASSGQIYNGYRNETGAQLPLNCTQWTNNQEVINKQPTAGLWYNDQTTADSTTCPNGNPSINPQAYRNGALWAYKMAVIKETWSAQNYYGAGGSSNATTGQDKFCYDEPTVLCAQDRGDGYYYLSLPTGLSSLTVDPGVSIGLWGGPAVGGFYSGCSFSGGVMALGTLVYKVPSDWRNDSGDTTSCFGKLRWNPATTPSIRARAAIVAAGLVNDAAGHAPTDGGYTPTYGWTFDNAQTAFGMAVNNQDSIDIYDAKMVLLASNVTATRLDDTHCTTLANYAHAKWFVSHGSPKWYFDSNWPRGNFLVLETLLDKRSSGEDARLTTAGSPTVMCDGSTPATSIPGYPNFYGYKTFNQTQYCLPFSTCQPRVIYITPNGESSGNSITYPFPNTFALDEAYGSIWLGVVQQTMTDLWWQAPHHPCSAQDLSVTALPGDVVTGSNIVWKEDHGNCIMDSGGPPQTMYYPLAPLVEAEITLPKYGMASPQTETPTLPAGITLGWLSPVTYTIGDVWYYPSPGGFTEFGLPQGVATEWAQWDTLYNAVRTTCRFGGIYAKWFIG